MATTTTRSTPAERSLGLAWVIATVVGWLIGFILCEAIKTFITTVLVDGLVIGTAVGIAQWLVLRRQFGRMGSWVVASIVGFGVGKWIGEGSLQSVSTVGPLLAGALIGLAVGVAQWLVLRRHVAAAEWWIPASVVAWAVGWAIISWAEAAEGSPTLTVYLVVAFGAAVGGIVTGVALIWLSRRRPA